MEPQPYAADMQEEMIRQIEAAQPRLLVVVDVVASWLPRPESPHRLLDWLPRCLEDHYDLIGIADIRLDRSTDYHWDAEALTHQPQSPSRVFTYERRRDGEESGS